MEVKKVAVVGGAGYAGIELVRYILGHPGFNLVAVTSDNDVGKPLTSLYPALLGKTNLAFSPHSAIDSLAELDAVFLAVPHTAAMAMAPKLVSQGRIIFDLSADFRLKDIRTYEQWYGAVHTAPELVAGAVYGLPEINRSLLLQKCAERIMNLSPVDNPVLIACPGCYPTASILAVAPALVMGAVDEDAPIVINALSGVTGAGRAAKHTSHYCTVDENVNAYSVATHRHTPEIVQVLSWEAGMPVQVVFTPHLIPMKRGLLATVAIQVKKKITADQLKAAYQEVYGDEPFVQVLPYGAMPRTASVAMTNNAQIGLMLDEFTHTLIVGCAIDNLGKGAASQAIQCANIVFDFDETTGLLATPGVA